VWFCNGLNGIHNMQEMSKQRHPCSLCVLLAFLGATPIFGTQRSPSESPQVGTKSELHIVIIQGDNAINNIKQCTAREVIVRVEDENKRPVGGASVAFSLPARGPSGVFAQGNRFLTVITDQNGRAATSALKLNHAVGAFKINVTASFQGHVGTAIVTQTNALASAGATASSAGGAAGGSGGGAAGGGAAGGAAAGGAAGAGAAAGISAATVAAIVGGAVVAGVVVAKVATSSKSSSTTSPPTASIGAPGSPVFGPGSFGGGVFTAQFLSGRLAAVTRPRNEASYAFCASKFAQANVLSKGRSLAMYALLGRLAKAQVVRFAAAHITLQEALGMSYKRGNVMFRIGAK
jgi:hypothetical protein